MKRTALLTATALLFAGTTSLSFAGDHTKNSANGGSSAPSVESVKPATSTGMENKHSVAPASQPSVTTPPEAKKATPTSKNEKQSEPVAENKPAATVSDAGKSTTNATSDQAKGAASESVKSDVPTPTMPTSPTAAATKTVVNPVTPAVPTPSAMPTK